MRELRLKGPAEVGSCLANPQPAQSVLSQAEGSGALGDRPVKDRQSFSLQADPSAL